MRPAGCEERPTQSRERIGQKRRIGADDGLPVEEGGLQEWHRLARPAERDQVLALVADDRRDPWCVRTIGSNEYIARLAHRGDGRRVVSNAML